MPGTHCTILAPIFNLRQFCGNRRQMPEIGGKYLSCEWQLCSVCYHQRLCLLQIWPISRCYASKLKLINISFALIQVLGLPAPLAQNQLSKRTCFRLASASHRRQSLFAESRRRSIISSSVLKSDMSERNSPRFSVLVIRKPLQPILDSRTRTALTGTLHALSVYQLLCSCSSSVLFHTNSFCECVIIN